MKVNAQQAERLHRFAHDLRNRLIGLQQVLDRLREGPSAEEREEFGLFGEQQFFKALREVEMLMDDLGVERGTVVPSNTRIILADLVREHVDRMQFRFERKQQTLELDLDETIAVQGDVRILGDLLDALLSNASKFSARNGPVRIHTRTQDNEAVVEVQDQGTGLSPADLEQVFVRFAWLNNRPTAGESQGRGTLARAREWASIHRGSLTATSAGEGLGCTFILRLPLSA